MWNEFEAKVRHMKKQSAGKHFDDDDDDDDVTSNIQDFFDNKNETYKAELQVLQQGGWCWQINGIEMHSSRTS